MNKLATHLYFEYDPVKLNYVIKIYFNDNSSEVIECNEKLFNDFTKLYNGV